MDVTPRAFERHLAALREPSTARRYAKAARAFLSFCKERRIDLRTAPAGLLSTYASWLVNRGLQASTVHVHIAGTKRYLEWVRANGVQISQMAQPDLPRVIMPAPDALTPEQQAAYIAACERLPEPVRMALLLLPYCGLRRSELVNLPLDAVQTLRDAEGALRVHLVVRGKGRKRREVPVLEQIYPRLGSYLRDWRAGQRKSPWLFGRGTGAPLSADTVRKAIKKVRPLSGLPVLTPHTLRRTYATRLLEAGVDPVHIAYCLGHSNVTTTKKSYFAMDATSAWRAIDRARTT